jgi:hypothetical protein
MLESTDRVLERAVDEPVTLLDALLLAEATGERREVDRRQELGGERTRTGNINALRRWAPPSWPPFP